MMSTTSYLEFRKYTISQKNKNKKYPGAAKKKGKILICYHGKPIDVSLNLYPKALISSIEILTQ